MHAMKCGTFELLDAKTFCDGVTGTSKEVLVTLRNTHGLAAQFTNYGARWVSMFVPDRNGIFGDIVLGFEKLSQYHSATDQYYGAIVGRVCGRIAGARFTLDGKTYSLAANDTFGTMGPNHLHGGIKGFHAHMWHCRTFRDRLGQEGVEFSLESLDGEEGYPGLLKVSVTYLLTNYDALLMNCEARTSRPTPINLTNHAYFNLLADGQIKSFSHRVTLKASKFLTCDKGLIPTGELVPVINTPYDFLRARTVEDSLTALTIADPKGEYGFSIPYVIDNPGDYSNWTARIEEESTGRCVDIYTNQPSLQMYTGFLMNGSDIGKYGVPYYNGSGLAFEPQGYPDAPNHDDFPSIILLPQQLYRHYTEYRFSVFR